MPRKTNFTVPMDNVVEVVSRTQRTKRGLQTSEKEVPIHSSHWANLAKLPGQSQRITDLETMLKHKDLGVHPMRLKNHIHFSPWNHRRMTF